MKILIIGSGISGLSAAIESADLGNDVVLVSPYVSERAQSVMAAGGINAALNSLGEDDNVTIHMEDTIKAGCYIEPESGVKRLCDEAPDNVRWLESLGVVFNRQEDGNICLRAFGGQSKRRTAYAGASTGKQIMTALINKCREYEIKGQITRVLRLHFHSALIKDGCCYGAVFCNAITGEILPIFADKIIIAAGGQNQIYGKTTGSMLCDGYVAGKLFTQGVKLRNLEFIQYHPTSIETSHKRMLISEAARGEGGRLYYLKDGQRVYFMEELFGPKGNLMPRDVVSKCIYDTHQQVYLDISFLGEKLIHQRLEEIYDLCQEYINLDVTKESIPVAPSIHFFMGGIWVDDNHRTNIENLYAVGECASKYHGANRLGGNSLLAAVHSGRTAARNIGSGDTEDDMQTIFRAYILHIQEEIKAMKDNKSQFPVNYILQNLAEIMNKNLGITRREDMLLDGLEDLEFYLNSCKKLSFDPSVSLYENYRMGAMFELAKATIMSALKRQESRGAHKRDDYPDSRDEFKKNSIAEYKDGEIVIAYED